MRLRLHYPTRALVERNQDALVTMCGGSLGVRGDTLIESALARPLNVLLYSDHATPILLDAAAAFAYGTRRNHPFVDGNKRASWLAMQALLVGNAIEVEIAGNSYGLREHAKLVPDTLRLPLVSARTEPKRRPGQPLKKPTA